MRKTGKIHLAVPICAVIVIFVYYFYGFKIQTMLHPDKTAEDMAQLNAMVLEKIDEGATEAYFFVSKATEDDIMNINENLCSMNGMVDKYSITEKSRGGMRVLFRFEISDNYYVYEKYKNGKAIPGDRPLAGKLYDEVVGIVERIIKPDMTDYEKELAIHDYLVSHCQYGYVDSSKDYAYRAYGALVQNTAVCNGYAEAMALLLSCVDVENKIITGTADGELHAWNLVKLDGNWYQVDATWDDPLPDKAGKVRHQYFNVTDEIMDAQHDWEQKNFPACDSEDYNYFTRNDLYCDKSEFEKLVRDTMVKDSTGVVEVLLPSFDVEQDFDFMSTVAGLRYFSYNEEDYGDYKLVTIYLNQRE